MPNSATIHQGTIRELLEGSTEIRRYVQRHSPDPTEAADYYQECIAIVLEQSRRRAIENPVAYAIRTARNLISKHKRPEQLEEDDAVSPAPSPEDCYHTGQRLAQIARVLEDMPPLRRQVFIRRRVYGESREQIAESMNISREAVKKHITRALVDIQLHLDKQG
ncbi:RNA polymerase sigma factor [Microbulbifer celer]|uniref:RNA polymerase sigma factor n=1 Tax=Microbulbifer celer TaxID=435905 RepID=A0ABW3UBJ8_9GAMM|nr:sigma-70 family RNA polymerase sigma factor [Microbulbifer celer]UFN56327.1 sigma-70 family RNA polymerase sigma factor [Microbulbifer celer]